VEIQSFSVGIFISYQKKARRFTEERRKPDVLQRKEESQTFYTFNISPSMMLGGENPISF
jgi:hypothetical protein